VTIFFVRSIPNIHLYHGNSWDCFSEFSITAHITGSPVTALKQSTLKCISVNIPKIPVEHSPDGNTKSCPPA
jgi:hypothetical protein